MLFQKELPYVLTDCDGTLTLDDFSLLEKTIDDVQRYQKKSGYRFSFITGRNAIVNKRIIDDLKIELPIVSCNGALITDKNGKVLHVEYLDKATCVAIFRRAEDLKIDLIGYSPDALVGTPNSNRIKVWQAYCQKQKPKHQFNFKVFNTLSDIADAIADEKIKLAELICCVDSHEQKQTMKALFSQFEEKVDVYQSTPKIFNVLKKGINKEFGLKKWAEIVGTTAKDVVVFGDNYNDIDMVKFASRGYAVGNAVEDLKQVAFKIVENVEENGVGKQLERFMKNED